MSQDLEKLQDSELLLQDDKDISSLSPAHKSKPKRFGVLNVLSWALNIVLLSLLLARSSKLTDPTLAVYCTLTTAPDGIVFFVDAEQHQRTPLSSMKLSS